MERAPDIYRLLPFGLLLIAALVLFLPVWNSLAAQAWTRPENAHGPLLLAFCFGALVVRIRAALPEIVAPKPAALAAGWSFLLLSIMMVIAGRSAAIEVVISAAPMPFAAGALLLLGGWPLIARTWVPVVLMAYLIVWPGWLLDALTWPLKLWISDAAANLLSLFELPVATSGVTLAIGQYQLLIADACAGLNALIALTATAAIYLYLMPQRSPAHTILLFAAAIPLAILANFIRVLILVLLTYYGGYDLGQGFMHEFAGLLMYGVALAGIFLLDIALNVRSRGLSLRAVPA